MYKKCLQNHKIADVESDHFIDPQIFAVHRFRPASPGVQTAVKQLVQRQELYIGQLERELAFCRFQS